MDLQTLLLAMSIPSGVTAFCFWLIEEKNETGKARKRAKGSHTATERDFID